MKIKMIILFLSLITMLYSRVREEDLNYFNDYIDKREESFSLIDNEYEGNRICSYILRDVISTQNYEKLQEYMRKNNLFEERTFINLLNLIGKLDNETYGEVLDVIYTYEYSDVEGYTYNSYLLKQYFDKNCIQPNKSLLNKILIK